MTDPLEISPEDVVQWIASQPDGLLLDCREPLEFELAHIPGARLMPMGEVPGRLQELEPFRNETLIVVCHHGLRSRQVAAWLRQQGFAAARSLTGGIDDWSLRIDPAVPRY